MAKLNKAVDEVRAKEARELARKGHQPILKHTCWCFLKRKKNRTVKQRRKLREVLQYPLRTVRAFLLEEQATELADLISMRHAPAELSDHLNGLLWSS